MNWLLLLVSFFLPLAQQQMHYAQQRRQQVAQPAPERTLYHVDGRWYTFDRGEWYVWTDNGWTLNLPQGGTHAPAL